MGVKIGFTISYNVKQCLHCITLKRKTIQFKFYNLCNCNKLKFDAIQMNIKKLKLSCIVFFLRYIKNLNLVFFKDTLKFYSK